MVTTCKYTNFTVYMAIKKVFHIVIILKFFSKTLQEHISLHHGVYMSKQITCLNGNILRSKRVPFTQGSFIVPQNCRLFLCKEHYYTLFKVHGKQEHCDPDLLTFRKCIHAVLSGYEFGTAYNLHFPLLSYIRCR